MKYTNKILSCLCVSLLSLLSPAFCDYTHVPGKSPIIVLQGEVTIDGLQRPDLGRSFADTLTGGFLKTKAYSVLDHLGNQPLAQAIENSVQLAPEQSAVGIGEAIGARWIYVPRMIVEGEFHKLTLKKIRVSDGQVVDVFETHGNGDRATMFLLIGEALKDIYAKTARDPNRIGKTPTGEALPMDIIEPEALDPTPAPAPTPGSYVPAPEPEQEIEAAETKVVSANIRSIPEGLKFEKGTHVRDGESPSDAEPESEPEPAKIIDPATETENKFASYIGTISTVNTEWRFCILKLRSSAALRIGDHLSVKTGTIVPDEVTLKVTKIEGRQAVADLVDEADLDSIKIGQSFYKWTPK